MYSATKALGTSDPLELGKNCRATAQDNLLETLP